MKSVLKLLKNLQILLLIFIFSACQNANEEIIEDSEIPLSNIKKSSFQEMILGVTIDDTWYDDVSLESIIEAVKKMPYKPTLRIVMSGEIEPKEYVNMFKRLHEFAFIMASPVDSFDMINYKTVESYRKRFEESYKELKSYVDIWEIGNEINGEGWLGDNNKLIVDKVVSAFDLLDNLGAKTALTAYYTKPKLQKVDMHDWLNKNIPQKMKKNLDYLFVSYYEDDNYGYQAPWQSIFSELEKDFPSVKLGIGECGFSKENVSVKEKIKKARYYYSMKPYTKNYVGGYFWWYWVSDCIPFRNNSIYNTINESFPK